MRSQGGTKGAPLCPTLLAAIALGTLCGVALAGSVGVVTVGAQMTGPPAEEKRSPKPQNSASNPASGQAEAIDAGRKLYVTWCVQCHGPKADGVSRFGKYAADLRAFWRGYGEFVTIVEQHRPNSDLEEVKERFLAEKLCIYADAGFVEKMMVPFATVLERQGNMVKVTFTVQFRKRLALLHRQISRVTFVGWTAARNL